MVADPRIVDDPKPISQISYKELRELAYMGASVLHEEAIYPVPVANIPINIRNTNQPEDPGTIITRRSEEDSEEIISGYRRKQGFHRYHHLQQPLMTDEGIHTQNLSILEDHI